MNSSGFNIAGLCNPYTTNIHQFLALITTIQHISNHIHCLVNRIGTRESESSQIYISVRISSYKTATPIRSDIVVHRYINNTNLIHLKLASLSLIMHKKIFIYHIKHQRTMHLTLMMDLAGTCTVYRSIPYHPSLTPNYCEL